VATLSIYPLYARLARRYGAWDPQHDILLAVVAALFGGVAIWLNWETLLRLRDLD
jgi:hypothetical protein